MKRFLSLLGGALFALLLTLGAAGAAQAQTTTLPDGSTKDVVSETTKNPDGSVTTYTSTLISSADGGTIIMSDRERTLDSKGRVIGDFLFYTYQERTGINENGSENWYVYSDTIVLQRTIH